MNNNQWPREKYNAMRKAFLMLAKDKSKRNSPIRLMVERAKSARKAKMRKRNHRKAMSVQQKRAAKGK